jgi:hypothetical protein
LEIHSGGLGGGIFPREAREEHRNGRLDPARELPHPSVQHLGQEWVVGRSEKAASRENPGWYFRTVDFASHGNLFRRRRKPRTISALGEWSRDILLIFWRNCFARSPKMLVKKILQEKCCGA